MIIKNLIKLKENLKKLQKERNHLSKIEELAFESMYEIIEKKIKLIDWN